MAFELGSYADLKGKRVLVTGGSAGIGKATALAFSKNHAIVCILGRRLERLEAVVKEMGSGYAVTADLSINAEAEKATKEAIHKLGGLDILINNGGVLLPEMNGDSGDALLAGIRLHVASAAILFEAAKDELLKNKGVVVNISSVASFVPQKNMMSYCVAKAAQDALTKGLAFKYADQGIRINAIQPAVIKTEAIESMAKQSGKTLEEMAVAMAPFHAMNRCAEPEEIAAPVLFLSSKASSFITGALLNVDGGVSLTSWGNHESVTKNFPKPE